MTLSTQSIKSWNPIEMGKHITDLVISSVIALFIVAGILLTNGSESFGIGHSDSTSFNFLSIFQTIENYKFGINKSESILLSASIVIGIGLIVLTVYSLLHIYLSRKLNTSGVSKRQRYQNYFTDTISDYAAKKNKFNSDRNHDKDNRVHLSKEDLIDSHNRSLLLKELKGMHSLITGDEKMRLKDHYYALGFIDDLPNKFKSPDWVQRVEAIQEAKQFEVTKYYPTIFRLINDSNETVRRNSLLARMDLQDNPLDILSELSSKLSIWEKHNIAMALNKMPGHLIPNFQKLVHKYPIHHEFLSEMKRHFHQDIKTLSPVVNAKLHVV